MGNDVGYVRPGVIRGCHLGPRTNRVLSLFSYFFSRYHASSLVGSAALIYFM